MQDVLREIRDYLSANAYQNEEHVRLSLVCRVLSTLGWDIWNPREVNAEFVPNRKEDNTKVDLALFNKGGTPLVFIEVKAVGKMDRNLPAIEEQVRDYNRNNTALFSIITDGRKWRLYYSQTGGQFQDKCFKHFDFIKDEVESIEKILVDFLTKESLSGDAPNKANEYLQLSSLQKAIQDCSPEADRLADRPPWPRKPEAIVQLLKERWPGLTQEKVEEHLKRIDTNPPSVFNDSVRAPVNVRDTVHFPNGIPVSDGDYKHSRASGTVAGKYGENWLALVKIGFETALNRGYTIRDLAQLNVNIQEGKNTKSGFNLLDGHNASFQGMDSNRSYHCLEGLAKKFQCQMELKIKFGIKHPSRKGEEITVRLP